MGRPGEDPKSAARRLQALIDGGPDAEDVARALAAIEGESPSRRRRLQAELLYRTLRQAAELASRLGWNGKAVLVDGQVLVDQDGVLLRAEPRHFRGPGAPSEARLFAPLQRFGVSPRTIVELGAGSGEASILLARRYPKARVMAVEGAADRLEAFETNLELQRPPLLNLEILRTPDETAGPFDRVCASLGRHGVDLLLAAPGAVDAGLAAFVRKMKGRIAAASIEFAATQPSEVHADVIGAFRQAGLVMLEKRSAPVAEPEAWLRQRLSERPSLGVLFVARDRLKFAESPLRRALAGLGDAGHRRALVYGAMDGLNRLLRTGDRRFEFEKLHAEDDDPWHWEANPYELEKYRRTLETALKWRRGRARALEIGCSIGMFTRMLAREFGEVTAADVASEALRLARGRVGGIGRVRFLRGDIRRLHPGGVYDAIFCAEMLYYMLDVEAAAPKVLAALKRSLKPDGIVIVVMPKDRPGAANPIAGRWLAELERGGLRQLAAEDVADPHRPYEIRVYEAEASRPGLTLRPGHGRKAP